MSTLSLAGDIEQTYLVKLSEAWPNTDEPTKQDYVRRTEKFCEQLAAWKGDSISSVDGHQFSDLIFTKLGGEKNCDPQNILNNCKELRMACSSSIIATWALNPTPIGRPPVLFQGNEDAQPDWRRRISGG